MMPGFRDRLSAFSSARLKMRVLNVGDAPSLQAITNDRSITDVISFLDYPFGLDDARFLIARLSTDQDCVFGIWTKSNSQLAGIVGAHQNDMNRIEIGYWVGTSFQGQGIAYEAASALLAKIEGAIPGVDTFAECAPENGVSRHLLEKLGFRATGEDGVRAGRKLFAYAKRG